MVGKSKLNSISACTISIKSAFFSFQAATALGSIWPWINWWIRPLLKPMTFPASPRLRPWFSVKSLALCRLAAVSAVGPRCFRGFLSGPLGFLVLLLFIGILVHCSFFPSGGVQSRDDDDGLPTGRAITRRGYQEQGESFFR